MTGPYVLKLIGESDLRGWVAAESHLNKLTHHADEFISAIKAGVGIDLGGRLVSGIGAIPGMFTDFIQRGLEFNKTIDSALTGLENVAVRFHGLDRESAKIKAAEAIERIKEAAPESAATLQQLIEGLMATAATAASAGIALEDNIDLVAGFANAASRFGVPMEQLRTELRAIFSGNVNADADLAKMLGITPQGVKRAREAGELAEYLRLALGDAGQGADDAATAFSALEDELDSLSGEVSKEIFSALVAGANELTEALKTPAMKAKIKELAADLGELSKSGLEMVRWAIQNKDALIGVSQAAGSAVAALVGIKIAGTLAGLVGKFTSRLDASRAALQASTAAANAAVASGASASAANSAGAAAGTAYTGGFTKGLSTLTLAVEGVLLAVAAYKIGDQIGKRLADATFSQLEHMASRKVSFASELELEIRLANTDAAKQKAIQSIKATHAEITSRLTDIDQERARTKDTTVLKNLEMEEALLRKQLPLVEDLAKRFKDIYNTAEKGKNGSLIMGEDLEKLRADRADAAAKKAAASWKKAFAEIEDMAAQTPEQQVTLLGDRLTDAYKKLADKLNMPQIGGMGIEQLLELMRKGPGDGQPFTEESAKELQALVATYYELEKVKKDIAAADLERKTGLETFRQEMEINRLKAEGNTLDAERLEKSKAIADLTKQLARDYNLSGAEASKLAQASVNAELGIEDARRRKALETYDAEMAIDAARARGEHRLAKQLEWQQKVNAEAEKLRELGLSDEAAKAKASEKLATELAAERNRGYKEIQKIKSELDKLKDGSLFTKLVDRPLNDAVQKDPTLTKPPESKTPPALEKAAEAAKSQAERMDEMVARLGEIATRLGEISASLQPDQQRGLNGGGGVAGGQDDFNYEAVKQGVARASEFLSRVAVEAQSLAVAAGSTAASVAASGQTSKAALSGIQSELAGLARSLANLESRLTRETR